MEKDCFFRSFNAGLRWSGIPDDVSIIQGEVTYEHVEQVATKYGLTFIDSGDHELGDNPLIAIYELDSKNHHAVFLSDNHPVSNRSLTVAIIGWHELRKRRFKWIIKNTLIRCIKR